MMRILIIFMTFSTFFIACEVNNGAKIEDKHTKEGSEQDEHEHEDVVELNKRQIEALQLKTGGFSMRNISTTIKINGQLKVSPEKIAGVSSVTAGIVKRINVFYGDKVRSGKVLAVLQHPDIITVQEQFSITAHNLQYLKQEYLRQKELFENSIAAGKVYEKAKADYMIAKSKYQSLKAKLRLLNISTEDVLNGKIVSTVNVFAPISGYITGINVKLGSHVDMEDVMFEITDNSDIHADFIVYEQDIPLLKEGQIIHFTVAGNTAKEYTATLYAIEKQFDAGKKAIHIHAKINENTKSLIPDMYISGHLHIDEKYTRTLPDDAVVRDGGKSYVFIMDNDEHEEENEDAGHEETVKYKKVEVITGKKDGGYTEVQAVEDLPQDVQIVLNAAYYLLADMKKAETEHHH